LGGSLVSGLLGSSSARRSGQVLANAGSRSETTLRRSLADTARLSQPFTTTSYETLNQMRAMIGLPPLAFPDSTLQGRAGQVRAEGGMSPERVNREGGPMDRWSELAGGARAKGGPTIPGIYELAEEGPEDLETPSGNYLATVYEPGIYMVHRNMEVIPAHKSEGGPEAESNGLVTMLKRRPRPRGEKRNSRARNAMLGAPGRRSGGPVTKAMVMKRGNGGMVRRIAGEDYGNEGMNMGGVDALPMPTGGAGWTYDQNNGLPSAATVLGAAPVNGSGTNALVPGASGSRSAPAPFDWQTDPGYKFRLDEGRKALENSAISRGRLLSGATAKGLTRYGQDYASDEFNKVFARIAGVNAGSSPFLSGQLNSTMSTGNALVDAYLRAAGGQAGAIQAEGSAWNNAIQGGLSNIFTLLGSRGDSGGGGSTGTRVSRVGPPD
jgi:hypothetical protein